MSDGEFSRVLDALEGQTKFIYYHLMGEPLTHPRLPDFVRLASDRGFKSIITTNGTLLARRGRELIDAGVHKVSISLHSFEADDADAHLRYLSQICDFADAASTRGTVVVLRLWNRGYDDGKNDVTFAYLQSRLTGEWMENTRGIRIRHKLHLEWGDRFSWPDLHAPRQDAPTFCYGLRDHFGILCDGSVVPCCMDSDGIITLGNIFTQTVDEILQTPRAKAILTGFDRHIATEELCRRCGYAKRFG